MTQSDFAVAPTGVISLWGTGGNASASAQANIIGGNQFVNQISFQITALDANSGKILWQRAITGVGSGSVTAVNGLVFFDNWKGEVYALSSKNGNTLWSDTTFFPKEYPAALPLVFLGGPISIVNGKLYIPFGINLGVPIPGGVAVFGMP